MKIALVGNQNSGKTTLFNDLTGLNQKIGNFPGVTIERKEGILKHTEDCVVVDLPGIYSLSPYSPEEEVSRKFIIDEKPDLIINIIDATSLERSLYLTTQLLELDVDVIVALNMSDILESHGISIDIEKLENELGTSVLKVSAMKEFGIDELIDSIINKKYIKNKHIKIYPDDIENLISYFETKISAGNRRFSAVKLIEDDKGYHSFISQEGEERVKELEISNNMDGEQLIASRRYDFIEKVKDKCVIQKERKESITDKLDKIFLNKWAAIPIFILIMGFIYFLSIGIVGGFTTPLIEVFFSGASSSDPVEFNIIFTSFEANIDFVGLGPWLSSLVENAGGSPWSMSLVSDGIIAGVGSVLSFFPQIVIMFLCLTLLETTGYMSRIAFFIDRIFHKFGLSGKSLIPFIVGSGCSVPGISATKIIEDENERKSTAILTPFVPCSAKLPIITLFTSFFFKNYAFLIALSFYLIAIVLILLFGSLFKKFAFKGEHSTFISELPEYKKPKGKYVLRDVWDKSISFITKAGTIILLFSILVWFLSRFSWNFTFLEISEIDKSMLSGIGNVFAWFFYPMLGEWSWGATVSAIQGLVAKEQVVASMSIIAGGENIFGAGSPFTFMTGPTAYAFLTFNLYSAPCMAAIGTLAKEVKNRKVVMLSLIFYISLAWVISTLIGLIGRGIML